MRAIVVLVLFLTGCATIDEVTCHTVRLGIVKGEPERADECPILDERIAATRESFRHMDPQTYRAP